ncbi:MAG: TrbC/VirB2 family protein [Methylotenera sp.]
MNNFIKNTKEALSIKPFHSSSMQSSEQQKQNQRLAKFVLVTTGACLLASEPSIVMAAAAGGTSNIEAAANRILTALTGPLGRTIAALGVVSLGVMAMFGKLAWDTAIKVIIGIALIFGAATVVTWIAGS